MAQFLPKQTPEDAWEQLPAQRDFAFLCGETEQVILRFGGVKGMFVAIANGKEGRALNNLDFESGAMTELGKVSSDTKIVFGRTSDCTIKLMNPVISRQHLEIKHTGNILTIRDLGSTNGTFFLKELTHFDIAAYLESRVGQKPEESTADEVHQAFGVGLDDFLKNYSETKGQ